LHLVTLIAVAVLQFFTFVPRVLFHLWRQRPTGISGTSLLRVELAGERAYSFNGPVWSVSVEVLVYMAFFFIALRKNRCGAQIELFGRRHLFVVPGPLPDTVDPGPAR
jgi:peptidoglycan/LPS O-acetylase OafA/YrhL